MWYIAIDVTCSVVCLSVCLSVCLLDTRVSPAKTAKPIEMPFKEDSRGPKEPCIRWGGDPSRKGAIIGVIRPIN